MLEVNLCQSDDTEHFHINDKITSPFPILEILQQQKLGC